MIQFSPGDVVRVRRHGFCVVDVYGPSEDPETWVDKL